jgi:hypothetical protein
MAKSKRPSGAQSVTCNKCKAEAHGITDTVHRWCRGNKNDRKSAVKGNRGTWH